MNLETIQCLREAAEAGYEVLSTGRDATLGVEVAIGVLESNPLFNAGRGSVLNEFGIVENDAGIVDGTSGRFGAVAALSGVLHPITIAAELMRRRPGPVFLAGKGALRFAREISVAEEDLVTDEQARIWTQIRTGNGMDNRSSFTGRIVKGGDTVGCIAHDRRGNLASGSSTGGMALKREGRVGDAPIFGAGIYADASVAGLCSGDGEASIELALLVRSVMKYKLHLDLREAAFFAIDLLNSRSARGGVILYDAADDVLEVTHNALSFPVLSRDERGHDVVDAIVRQESDRAI